jgi:hypothetical protein
MAKVAAPLSKYQLRKNLRQLARWFAQSKNCGLSDDVREAAKATMEQAQLMIAELEIAEAYMASRTNRVLTAVRQMKKKNT